MSRYCACVFRQVLDDNTKKKPPGLGRASRCRRMLDSEILPVSPSIRQSYGRRALDIYKVQMENLV